jgi:hypothetical protein
MRIAKFILMLAVLATAPALAQGPPPNYSPAQLDQMVSRIALYPDSLVAQILAAATYSDQIPDAAQWADQHHYLTGSALADAIQGDQLPWDPSVQALLPFPSVLEMMSRDMNWTTDIGNAFLARQQDVMDAISENGAKLAITAICAATGRSSWARVLTSRSRLQIPPSSSCRTTTRELFSSGHVRELLSAARFDSGSACRSALSSGRGAGAITVLTGTGAPSSLITRRGAGTGTIESNTGIPMKAFIAGGRAIECQSTTNWKSAHHASVRTRAKAAGSTRNIAAAGTTATIAVAITTTGKPKFLDFLEAAFGRAPLTQPQVRTKERATK